MDARRLTRLALLIAVGAVLHWLEAAVPAPVPVPGAKLGLANIVTLYAIVAWGLSSGLYVAAGRALLGSLVGGTFGTIAFAMSLSGAVTAALVMGLLLRLPLGPAGLSMMGALTHNMTQLAVFALVTRYAGVFVYTPYLILLALPAGLVTGLVALFFLKRSGYIAAASAR
ncbi:MAG: Gx transporter family protein [Bacillota bacterium]